jgi:hypothetical protein
MASFDRLAAIQQVVKMVPNCDTQTTVWNFQWDEKVSLLTTTGLYTPFFLRDIVNTHEFRAAAEDKLSKQMFSFCTVHALERDTEVSADGKVVKDMAILNVTFSKDGPCDNCGEHTKNGRMTCLCWADEEDIARMDRDAALHR